MNLQLPEIQMLKLLTADGKVLFSTRVVRLFAYGLLSVVLALYLAEIGLTGTQIGLLLSLTLAGDVVVSLAITTVADRIGRRVMLQLGAVLVIFAGIVFAWSRYLPLLTIAAIIGTISPSGNEVGPFLAIEQAALTQTLPVKSRTQVFAWYSLVGSLATALGSLCGGALAQSFRQVTGRALDGYRAVIVLYASLGMALLILFARLSPATEIEKSSASSALAAEPRSTGMLGLRRSRGFVIKLSGLFMIDAFAGGLIVQSLVAYWFYVRFGVRPALLGGIFFGANIFAGVSALAAARIANRIGLVNTMVWTHVPSNILLMLVPLMPNLPLAIAVLMARFSISQMDVPTRQSYTMAVVDPEERSAAAGVTNVARTAASALAPLVTGGLFGAALLSLPFFLSGGLKICYDLLLFRSCRAIRPPEERVAPQRH
jgi:MFS family permease